MPKNHSPTLSSSAENYLEAILQIEKNERVVRLKHISDFLDVSAASVNAALRTLAKRGLVRHEKYGHVELTATGRKQAKKIANRHQIIIRFLRDILMVDPETSSRDACKIEHAVSRETVGKLAEFTEFVDGCRRGAPDPNNFFHALARLGKKKQA